MNNQTTRIWTTLRYLALIPLIALGILSILATSDVGNDFYIAWQLNVDFPGVAAAHVKVIVVE